MRGISNSLYSFSYILESDNASFRLNMISSYPRKVEFEFLVVNFFGLGRKSAADKSETKRFTSVRMKHEFASLD